MALLSRFADLLEYPGDDLERRIAACAAACRDEQPGLETESTLAEFEQAAVRLGMPLLEQEYTAAFDLDARCTLYAGHQLFGDGQRRSEFMCRLAAEYRQNGFAIPMGELPDALPLMLRYAEQEPAGVDAASRDAEATRQELLAEVALPVARRLAEELGGRAHPYTPVLRALVAALAERASGAEAAAALEAEP